MSIPKRAWPFRENIAKLDARNTSFLQWGGDDRDALLEILTWCLSVRCASKALSDCSCCTQWWKSAINPGEYNSLCWVEICNVIYATQTLSVVSFCIFYPALNPGITSTQQCTHWTGKNQPNKQTNNHKQRCSLVASSSSEQLDCTHLRNCITLFTCGNERASKMSFNNFF